MPPGNARIADLERKLNDFDPAVRARALAELAALAREGAVTLPAELGVANMHCHTFFSYNACGHSPASLAWLGRRSGFRLMGIVDFDVLDGVDEFLEACDLLGVRGTAGIETRVHIPEFATREINSPGEPGISYHMGIGFTSRAVPPAVAASLAALRRQAGRRNREMVSRINDYLAPVSVDYERDVLSLTPGGYATERHIVAAYMRAAERALRDPGAFWTKKLGVEPEQAAGLTTDTTLLQNLIRARLMKRGGIGYVRPGPDTFPSVDELHRLITGCGALPCAAWLDGTSAGEQAMEELLELLTGKGVVALNIIPDRNWNIADLQARQVKVRNLYNVVRLAEEMALPLNVGTEMNSPGQKWVDDFGAPELTPLRNSFLDGAHFVYGHTVLQRALGLGYGSEWARAHLPSRRQRNDFYTQVGCRVAPGKAGMAALTRVDVTISPADILAMLGA